MAFRKRRYKNEAFEVEVYKGLGEYEAYIFAGGDESVGHCTLRFAPAPNR